MIMAVTTSTIVAPPSSLQGKVGMGTGHHRVCGVVSPDSDGLVEMAMATDVATFDNE